MMRILFLVGLVFLFSSNGEIESGPSKNTLAPDIVLENPKGKTIKLSSLKGKMVLVDFWASWCGPCRRENPNVVEVYNKYHKAKFKNAKGFEIYSVSLDRNESSWIDAIEKDGLDWKYHGWDKNNVVSTEYGVSSIPSAFLIDGEGKIVASGNDVRGLNLHLTLDQYVTDL